MDQSLASAFVTLCPGELPYEQGVQQRFVSPEEFVALRQDVLQLGFSHVQAGPLVRSSCHADQAFHSSPSP